MRINAVPIVDTDGGHSIYSYIKLWGFLSKDCWEYWIVMDSGNFFTWIDYSVTVKRVWVNQICSTWSDPKLICRRISTQFAAQSYCYTVVLAWHHFILCSSLCRATYRGYAGISIWHSLFSSIYQPSRHRFYELYMLKFADNAKICNWIKMTMRPGMIETFAV